MAEIIRTAYDLPESIIREVAEKIEAANEVTLDQLPDEALGDLGSKVAYSLQGPLLTGDLGDTEAIAIKSNVEFGRSIRERYRELLAA